MDVMRIAIHSVALSPATTFRVKLKNAGFTDKPNVYQFESTIIYPI